MLGLGLGIKGFLVTDYLGEEMAECFRSLESQVSSQAVEKPATRWGRAEDEGDAASSLARAPVPVKKHVLKP